MSQSDAQSVASAPPPEVDATITHQLMEAARQVEQHIGPHSSRTRPTYFHLPVHPGLGDLVPICVPHKPLPKHMKQWAAIGYYPVWHRGSKRHPHALLGAGRALAENRIIELVKQLSISVDKPLVVADVGSNADRFRTAIHTAGSGAYFAKIHHLIPIVQGGDVNRLVNARGKYSHCTCMFESCAHTGDADAYVFQHSLYYFGPEFLSERLPIGTVAYASVHHIFDACGSLQDNELVYHIGDDGRAHCKAHGNNTTYVHPPNPWLTAGSHRGRHNTLVWEEVDDGEFFSSHVYVLRTVPNHSVPDLSPLPDPHESDDYADRLTGSIKSSSADRMLGPGHATGAALHIGKIKRVTFKYGLGMVVEENDRCTAIPRDLIGTLQSMATLTPRTAVLERSMAAKAARYLTSGNMPPEKISRVILIAVCAALVRDVEAETAAIGRMHHTHSRIFAEHTRVMSGGTIGHFRWWHYLLPSLWGGLLTSCCYSDEHDTSEALAFHSLRNRGIAPTTTLTTRVTGTFPPTHGIKTATLPPLAKGASIKVLPETRKPPPEQTMRLVLTSLGPVMPTTARNGVDSLVAAFRVRIGRDTPTSSKAAWDQVLDAVKDPYSAMHAFVLEPIRVTRDIMANWLQKFPLAQREKFVLALADLRTRPLNPSDFQGSAMIKTEKSGMCDVNGPPVLDSRIVISYRPTRQVVTGPYDWMAAKQLRANLSPDPDHPIVWVNGPEATSEAFGTWFDHHVAMIYSRFGTVYYIYGDQAKFEAHRDENAFNYTKRLMFHAIRDPSYMEAREASVVLKGRGQRHDVAYRAKYKLGSGGTETSLDSIQRNVAGLYHAFGEPEPGRLAMSANGDDWLVLSGRPYDPTDFSAAMLRMGFESDFSMTVDVIDIEFCQTLPWPTQHGTVWGPKIGRVLTRLPWAAGVGKDDPRGVAIGMLTTCSHIPFVRTYLHYVAANSPGVDPIEYKFHISAETAHEADEETWAYCMARYHLSPEDEEAFASMLSGVPLGSAITWPHLARVAEIDA